MPFIAPLQQQPAALPAADFMSYGLNSPFAWPDAASPPAVKQRIVTRPSEAPHSVEAPKQEISGAMQSSASRAKDEAGESGRVFTQNTLLIMLTGSLAALVYVLSVFTNGYGVVLEAVRGAVLRIRQAGGVRRLSATLSTAAASLRGMDWDRMATAIAKTDLPDRIRIPNLSAAITHAYTALPTRRVRRPELTPRQAQAWQDEINRTARSVHTKIR